MKKVLISIFSAAILAISCGGHQESANKQTTETDSLSQILAGDSSVYGLACDGCTDTILVFLPINDIAANPDTFNILNATRLHRIYGRLKTGDKIAVVKNKRDSTIADCVIDMENLKATWCYQVLPTLHVTADMEGSNEKQILKNLPDSVRQLLDTPREYSIQIKGDYTVTSTGGNRRLQSNSDEQLVDYPQQRRYGQWNLYNGKLLLTEIAIDSLGNPYSTNVDTADFVLMDRDTLILRFNDGVRNFYPKKEQ